MNNKSRVLFIVQLPPPVHGSSSISKIFVDSTIINSSFNLKVFPLQFAKGMHELGSFSLAKVFKTFTYSIQLINVLKSFRPSLIYFTISPKGFSFYRDVLFVIIFKIFNSKIVYHLHVKGIQEESNKNPLKKILYKFVFKNSYPISLSAILAKDISAVCDTKPYIVNNGIYNVTTELLRSNKPATKKKIQLLYFSNLVKSKGVFVLLKALQILNKKNNNFYATIIGKPGDVTKNEIDQFILQGNLKESVVVSDAKYGHEKFLAFRNADIFIHPTLNDAFPLVILEAMQFALPVISTSEGAIPEIVDEGITGFLTPQNNEVALAKKIEILLSNEQLRIDMGNAGREKFLACYTADLMEKNLKDVFMKILT